MKLKELRAVISDDTLIWLDNEQEQGLRYDENKCLPNDYNERTVKVAYISRIPALANRLALVVELYDEESSNNAEELKHKIERFIDSEFVCPNECMTGNTICEAMEPNPFRENEYRCANETLELTADNITPVELFDLLVNLGYVEDKKKSTMRQSIRFTKSDRQIAAIVEIDMTNFRLLLRKDGKSE